MRAPSWRPLARVSEIPCNVARCLDAALVYFSLPASGCQCESCLPVRCGEAVQLYVEIEEVLGMQGGMLKPRLPGPDIVDADTSKPACSEPVCNEFLDL